MPQPISMEDALAACRERLGELTYENVLLRTQTTGLERQLTAAQEENARLQQAKPDPSAGGPDLAAQPPHPRPDERG